MLSSLCILLQENNHTDKVIPTNTYLGHSSNGEEHSHTFLHCSNSNLSYGKVFSVIEMYKGMLTLVLETCIDWGCLWLLWKQWQMWCDDSGWFKQNAIH